VRTVAIIQARMGSTRLPGKVLLRLADKTVLEHTIARVRDCSLLDGVVVATTDTARDDEIAAEAARCGAAVFRGSEDDVLSRYYFAALRELAEIVVRVTSDCPLFDGHLLTLMIERFSPRNSRRHIDYLSNTLNRTFPRGLDAEVFTFAALKTTHYEATTAAEREHVTPYLYRNPQTFAIENFENHTDLSEYRWTLDTPEDFQMIETVYSMLYRSQSRIRTSDVVELLAAHPEIAALNAHVEQKKVAE
jgi:spore coat polysaccharide biosynthesis protein SpsF